MRVVNASKLNTLEPCLDSLSIELLRDGVQNAIPNVVLDAHIRHFTFDFLLYNRKHCLASPLKTSHLWETAKTVTKPSVVGGWGTHLLTPGRLFHSIFLRAVEKGESPNVTL